LTNFSKDFNQNKETAESFRSKKHKIGEYNWALEAKVRWNHFKNEYFLAPYLQCLQNESFDKTEFPLGAFVKFSILNHEKDSRKTCSVGKTDY
jgi:hypothetical protein